MINSSDYLLDFQVSPTDAITLAPEQIEQAVQLSDLSTDPAQQWQTYLNTLALFGFEAWLTQRDPELVLEKENSNSILNTICQINIGEFKLCLLSQGTLDDELVTIAIPAIDSPEYLAHLYTVVTVDEEQEQISVEGVIRYDELQEFQQSGNLTAQSDGTYEIPFAWFDPDANHLLLYLRCLEPSAIQLPNSAAILETQSERFTQITQSVINVGTWLQGQLDEVAQNLSWILLPNLQFATAFRSLPTLDIVIEELQERGMIIPYTARGASQIFSLAAYSLQLYALAWLMEDTSEWSLLLILGTPSDQPLPEGLKLVIQDSNGILGEQKIEPNSDQSYLYTQVIGERNEQFIVTIAMNNQELVSPFTLRSQQ